MESKILDEIKEYMEKYDITYVDIAKKAGLSKQRVWYYFNGGKGKTSRPDISVGNLEKICAALGFKLMIQLNPMQ